MFQVKKHGDFVLPWKQAMATGLMTGRPFSQHTQHSYAYYVTDFLRKYDRISFEHLRTELSSIPIDQFAKKDEIYKAIVSFAKYLIGERALNPVFLEQAKKIRPKRHQEPKRQTVKQEDLQRLFSVSRNPLDRFIVMLLASTGLRASEACSLKIQDVDFENRIIFLYKGKWGKSRRVGITDGLMGVMLDYLKTREPLNPHEPLLRNQDGNPIQRNGMYKRLQKLGRKANVEVSPHALRRAFVTINVSNNVPLPYLQIACGHSDIKTTRSYCQTTEEEVIEAMKTRFTSFSWTPQPDPPLSDHTASSSESTNDPPPVEPL